MTGVGKGIGALFAPAGHPRILISLPRLYGKRKASPFAREEFGRVAEWQTRVA
jgi:hypothetical protein